MRPAATNESNEDKSSISSRDKVLGKPLGSDNTVSEVACCLLFD